MLHLHFHFALSKFPSSEFDSKSSEENARMLSNPCRSSNSPFLDQVSRGDTYLQLDGVHLSPQRDWLLVTVLFS